jgi:hypothetical protein
MVEVHIVAGLLALLAGLGVLVVLDRSLLLAPAAIACGTADFRLLTRGGTAGTPRLVRHLWRMTFALWVATASFFLGQADVIPEPLRNFALLSVPLLAVLGTLLYWLWRSSMKKTDAAAAAPGGVR